jgi:hypothetical protein
MKIYKLFIISCLYFCFSGCYTHKTNLQEQLKKVFTPTSKEAILSKVDTSKWDKMYIVSPYTSRANLPDELFIYKDIITKTNITMRDDIILFIFEKHGRLADNFTVNRSELDLGVFENKAPNYFTTSQILLYSKRSDNNGYIIRGVLR